MDESLNLGDITKVDENNLKPFTMICGGSPCQDFSVAGKQKGSKWRCADCGEEYNPLTVHYSERHKCPKCGSENLDKTRSSLLVEWLRIIRANKPKWGIYENVKNIVGKQFKETFEMFINELDEYGYNTYYKILNAKDFGIPQNRERLYLLLIKKDLDNYLFEFPNGFYSDVLMCDILEDENLIPEKYYVESEKEIEAVDDIIKSGKLDNNYYSDANIDRYIVERRIDEGIRTFKGGVCGAIRTINSGGDKRVIALNNRIDDIDTDNYGIRKLTPRECWRLMDFSDIDYNKVKAIGISDSQLYKMAGNSICVGVLYHIYKKLYEAMSYLFNDLKVGSFFSGIGAFEKGLDRLFTDINGK